MRPKSLGLAISIASFACLYCRADGTHGRTITVPPPVSVSASLDTPAGARASEDLDTLVFFNGDRLHGSLEGFTLSSNGLKWSRVDVAESMAFKPGAVASIDLAGRAKRAEQKATATVTLSNKDSILCTVAGIDEKGVVVDTGPMGRMVLQRNMVTSVALHGGSASVVYDGPNEPSEWTFSNADFGGNKVERGAMYLAHGNVENRFLNYPDTAEVRFSMSWRQYPSIVVLVVGAMQGGSYRTGYAFTFQSTSAYIYRYSPETGSRPMANFNVEKFGRSMGGTATFQILLDRKKKMVSLLIDGELMKTFTENADFPSGNSLVFSKSSGGGDVAKITAIRVSQWDGKIPVPQGAGSGATKDDVVRLKNGDKLTGKLDGVADGKVSVTTSFASLSIPAENVEEMLLSSATLETPRRNKMDVRVFFSGYGTLTGDLGSIERDVLQFRSESFGNVSVPLNALRRIEFNIYKDRPASGSRPWFDGGIDGVGFL